MMARTELVTPRQRQLLRELATGPNADASWVDKIPASPARKRFLAGRSDPGKLGVKVPAHFRRYLELGRFRNALLAAEESRRPTPALKAFIAAYKLEQYRIKSRVATRKK